MTHFAWLMKILWNEVHADAYVFISYLRWEVSFFDVYTAAGGNRKTAVISWCFLHALSEQNIENGRR